MVRLAYGLLVVLFAVVACDATDIIYSPPSYLPPSEPGGGAAPRAASIDLSMDTLYAFPGMGLAFDVTVRDRQGREISGDSVEFTVLNPSVAMIDGRSSYWVLSDSTAIRHVHGGVRLLSPGTTRVEASLHGVRTGVSFTVLPDPPLSTALVVDSFAIEQYVYSCSAPCSPYMLYAPVLRLREPSGFDAVEIIGLDFAVPWWPLRGWSRYHRPFLPGEASYLMCSLFPDSIYDSDVFWGPTGGNPLPEGNATVRLLLRDALGRYGRVEATAAIPRLTTPPPFPTEPRIC
jgi:hypothetical protein